MGLGEAAAPHDDRKSDDSIKAKKIYIYIYI